MKRKHGFTLIELLVVVAIIAVLTAILLPSIKRARQHALWTICAGRLHVWGQVLIMYADNNNGFFITRTPLPVNDSNDLWPACWWASQRNHLRDNYKLVWPVWSPPEAEKDIFPAWHEAADGGYRIWSGYVYLPRHKELALSNAGRTNAWPFNILRDLRKIGDDGEMGSTQGWCFSDHSPIPLVTDLNYTDYYDKPWRSAHKSTGGDPGGATYDTPEISHSVWPDGHVETRSFDQIYNKNYAHGVCGVFTW